MLFYFKSQKDVIPKGILRLEKSKTEPSPEKKNCFIVKCSLSYTGDKAYRNRVYHFQASSQEERDSWIGAITKAEEASAKGLQATNAALPNELSTKGEKPLILIVGASGKIGSLLTKALVLSGLRVRVMLRQMKNEAFEAMGAEVMIGDLENGMGKTNVGKKKKKN